MIKDKFDDTFSEQQIRDEYFPALQKYKNEHNIPNLKKLCVEVLEFCRAIYASTQSPEERQVYREFVEKLNK